MQLYSMIFDQTVTPLPWQEELKPGDYCLIQRSLIGIQIPSDGNARPLADFQVYGQILDARNCKVGFFNIIQYSVICPNGEEVGLCILDVKRAIDRDEFEAARREGWVI
jgi:hypothetical protein